MKLNQSLIIANITYSVISTDIRLAVNDAGRAQFIVQTQKPLSGTVIYQAGWSGQQMRTIFIGFIERVVTINKKEQTLFCRELCAVLECSIPVALRLVTVKQVLDALAGQTSLQFITPEDDKQLPYFYTHASGIKTLDDIGRVYQIPRYCWQQQENGAVFVGSWQDSPWAEQIMTLPDVLFTDHCVDNSARLGFMPALRPMVNTSRGIIKSVTIKDQTMELQWMPLKN